MFKSKITFPEFTGLRCLMMPYIQGDTSSLPEEYLPYFNILENLFFKKGDIGFLTIDESKVLKGKPHRGDRAKYGRAIHTEVGRTPERLYCWGGGNWGGNHNVFLEKDTKILLSNNLDNSCAVWDAEHEDTSIDGDIGHMSNNYPYEKAIVMKAGDVYEIGILTPHESLPVRTDVDRQFIRVISAGVHGIEPYFTTNPLLKH